MTDPQTIANIYPSAAWAEDAAEIVADFHRLWYDTDRYASVTWWGHECWKYPTDMLIYAEIVHALRPVSIIETGTYRGGSTLFWAHLLELLHGAGGPGRVLSVDIHSAEDLGPDPRGQMRPTHPRISYIQGSSVDPEIVARVAAERESPTLVILDSDHTAEHVAAELDAYAPMADLIIVEDTNLGHDVLDEWGPGPREAVDEWLRGNGDWYQDRALERLLLTCAPGGFLRRA